MESWRTEEAVDSLGVQLKNRRSIGLTVVCILTWVGCGIPFTLNLIAFSSTNLKQAFVNTGKYSGIWFFLDWFVFPALCALGAVFMFRLKRWGFWIYCVGQIPPIVFSIYSVIGMTKSLGSGVFFGLLWNCLSIAFVVFYAIEMNKLSRKTISTDF
ncbi:hypothetical protein [Fluviicola sp.]|uniref:hypothetical protein n=1 Tax=Fluviicola sp. TaxID=1917219 RepID=UPI0031D0AC78